MNDTNKKDYEQYLAQDEETWGEFFSNIKKYWDGVMADVNENIQKSLTDLDEATSDIADYTDDPEIMEMAVTAGRIRTLASASENAMSAIGKCLGAVSSLFGKN